MHPIVESFILDFVPSSSPIGRVNVYPILSRLEESLGEELVLENSGIRAIEEDVGDGFFL